MKIKTKLATRLKKARLKKGLSLREVERLSRGLVSNAYLSQLENGVYHNPHPLLLKFIAKTLELDYVELLMLADYLTQKDIEANHDAF